MLKLSDNPAMTYPPEAAVADIPGPWWVAHTKARFEKAFAWDLADRGIPYYLPMVQKITFSGGRKRKGLAPLFTSYVFFCGDAATRHHAMCTGRLCQTIEVKEQSQLVRELAMIQRALSGEFILDPYPHAAIGKRCRVLRGPLEGIEGVVVRRDDMVQLVLEVRMLGVGAGLEIEADLVEAVE